MYIGVKPYTELGIYIWLVLVLSQINNIPPTQQQQNLTPQVRATDMHAEIPSAGLICLVSPRPFRPSPKR